MDINSLRMRSIFGNPTPTNPTNVPIQTKNISVEDAGPNADNVKGTYEPHHELFDKLVDTIKNMPERKPKSGLDRVASGVSRLSGFSPANYSPAGDPLGIQFNQKVADEAQSQVDDSDYNKQMGDFKDKLNVAKIGSDEEQQNNTNSRMLQIALEKADAAEQSRKITQDHYDDMDKYYNGRLALNDQQLAQKVQEHKDALAALEVKRKQAEAELEIRKELAKGGTLRADDKTGKTYMVYKDGTKKDVDLTTLTPEQRNGLEINKQVNIAAGKGADKPLSPTQQAVERLNKITTMLSEHPEWKDKYLEVDPVKNQPTGRVINKGGDQKIFDSINAQLESPRKMTDAQMREEAINYIRTHKLADGVTPIPETEENIAHILKVWGATPVPKTKEKK